MKKNLGFFVVFLFLSACSEYKPDSGDAYLGSWKNQQNTAVATAGAFKIDDRILIARTGNAYEAMLFRQGGGAVLMFFNEKTGYLCNQENACLRLKNKDTLELTRGTETILYVKDGEIK